ncbi:MULTISPECIES: replication initiation negative regulator SeqA [unclassified Motilimonas]|uniref:replication initiation negative regulator SeqA n=1 Tax=Motilimonas TaxID=1914248 RepID=UPI001E35AF9A|nr:MULTISPECIES: replication initiation negative regulator SeqA [unclassified Motilimonas]MCE0556737.1 replication initiation negative regulator SeqA [Motilimonas sp. E26]MDO6526784.1 replication initiation negative regulator SeqA [Motilimonas sp. 1_MG-2023]
MKKIELDDELYQYIAAQTKDIGESASQILRRLLSLPPLTDQGTTEAVKCSEPLATKQTVKKVLVKAEPSVTQQETPDSASLQSFLDSAMLANVEHSVERFLLMLSQMYKHNQALFASASETTRGRKRLYLATSQEALEEGGKTCKPRAIPDTPFWVITNANTGRKRIIIAQLMASMGYAHHVIEKACEKI